jgi:exodeoxyribonuclease X
MNLIFLDTETTGLEVQDRLIQVAYKWRPGSSLDDLPKSAYFRPDCPISFEAMAVNHITTEMVLQEPTFQQSIHKQILDERAQDHILVAHNAKFDMGMLQKEGVDFKVWIDSKRVAQHLIDSKRYNLQYLRYSLGLNSEGMAHDASGDVQVLEKLFDFMAEKIKQEYSYNDQQVIDHMVTLSNRPVLLRRFNFGKHRDKLIKEVCEFDRSYLVWLYNSEMSKIESERDEDMCFTLKSYLSHN